MNKGVNCVCMHVQENEGLEKRDWGGGSCWWAVMDWGEKDRWVGSGKIKGSGCERGRRVEKKRKEKQRRDEWLVVNHRAPLLRSWFFFA